MIVTGRDLRRARLRLGWSCVEFAQALRLTGERYTAGGERVSNRGNRIAKMESGAKPVTGPITVATEAFLDGWRPEGFEAWLKEFRRRKRNGESIEEDEDAAHEA